MKLLYEWGIPSAGFLIWIVLSRVIVPVFLRYLNKKTQRKNELSEIHSHDNPTFISCHRRNG
jgi:hypothetical protein